MNAFVTAFFFFLPAGFANMAPILANKIPGLNKWQTQLDFGKSYKGKRIFGDNKTFRGVLAGIVVAAVVAGVLSVSVDQVVIHSATLSVLAGALMGLGALTGDAVKSFFKRRANVKPGQSWFPYDQTDYIVGGLLVILPFIHGYNDLLGLVIRVFVLYFGLHLVIVFCGFKLGVRDAPI